MPGKNVSSVPVPRAQGIVPTAPTTGQSGNDNQQITTTIIQPSPGTTTEVIIRPAVVDLSNPNAVQGKTRVFRFPPPSGDSPKIQIEQQSKIKQPPPISNEATLVDMATTSQQSKIKQPPVISNEATLVDMATTSQQPASASGSNVRVKSNAQPNAGTVEQTSGSTPYSYQSQRMPLPGVKNATLPTSVPGGELLSTDPTTPALDQVLMSIQLLSVDFEVIDGQNGNVAYDILRSTDHIFMEPAPPDEFSEASIITSNNFCILDSYGSRLFCAFEKKQKRGGSGCCRNRPPVQVAIVDRSGTECMSLTGSTQYITIRDPSVGIIGFVQEVQSLLPLTTGYLIKDKNGHIAFKLLPDKAAISRHQFDVYGTDMLRIGHIGKCWGHLPDSPVDMSHSYGLSFPKDMNVDEKYWKLYGDKYGDQREALAAWCCIGSCCIGLLAIIFALAILAAYIVHPA